MIEKWDIAQLMTKTLQGLWSRTRLVLIGANMMYGVGIVKSSTFTDKRFTIDKLRR